MAIRCIPQILCIAIKTNLITMSTQTPKNDYNIKIQWKQIMFVYRENWKEKPPEINKQNSWSIAEKIELAKQNSWSIELNYSSPYSIDWRRFGRGRARVGSKDERWWWREAAAARTTITVKPKLVATHKSDEKKMMTVKRKHKS